MSDFLSLTRQLDLACQNRDLRCARRIVYRLCQSRQDDPPELGMLDAVLRVYAAQIHGWEITDA